MGTNWLRARPTACSRLTLRWCRAARAPAPPTALTLAFGAPPRSASASPRYAAIWRRVSETRARSPPLPVIPLHTVCRHYSTPLEPAEHCVSEKSGMVKSPINDNDRLDSHLEDAAPPDVYNTFWMPSSSMNLNVVLHFAAASVDESSCASSTWIRTRALGEWSLS